MSAEAGQLNGNVSIEEFSAVLAREAQDPISGDEVIGAYSCVMHELIETDPEIRRYFEGIFRNNHYEDADHAANLNFKSVQAWIIGNPLEQAYPVRFHTADAWRQILPKIFIHDSSINDARHWMDMSLRKLIVTNVAERYVTYPLLQLAFPDRFIHPDTLDIGASQNIGPKHIALRRAFHYMTVAESPHLSPIHTQELTVKLNKVLAKPLEMGQMYGVDIWRDDDALNAQWARSSRFRPAELEDPEIVREYDELVHARHLPNVHFVLADFGAKDVKVFRHAIEQHSFDWVTLFTILYMIPPEERQIMFNNAKRYVKDDGLIVVQDAMKLKAGHEGPALLDDFEFSAKNFSEDFGYSAWAYEMRDQEAGFQELWRFDTGRCHKIQFTDTKLSLRAIAGLHRQAAARP